MQSRLGNGIYKFKFRTVPADGLARLHDKISTDTLILKLGSVGPRISIGLACEPLASYQTACYRCSIKVCCRLRYFHTLGALFHSKRIVYCNKFFLFIQHIIRILCIHTNNSCTMTYSNSPLFDRSFYMSYGIGNDNSHNRLITPTHDYLINTHNSILVMALQREMPRFVEIQRAGHILMPTM